MTGTSIDALDVALVRITGHGLDLRAKLLATHTQDLGSLATGLRKLADQQPMRSADIATLSLAFSRLHVGAVAALLLSTSSATPPRPDLICVHGQTVAHRPPVSWQLFNPWPLVFAIGAPVVFDLRGADLACSGQGAPITPIADWVLFRGPRLRAIVNLGGFCNITGLPAESASPAHIRASDICACNQVLDALARERLDAPYDLDGANALRGRPHDAVVAALVASLREQSKLSRSLGTGDELASHPILSDPSITPQDAARSACCAIAQIIVEACVRAGAAELVLAGGGVRNAALVEELRVAAKAHGQTVTTSDTFGVPAPFREAMAFAVLGALCQDRVPITLAAVTGAPGTPVAGCWAGV